MSKRKVDIGYVLWGEAMAALDTVDGHTWADVPEVARNMWRGMARDILAR